ncbi:MAG TPA: hypothetical protein VIR34_14250 [Gemmatimonadaceae bacterium]
MPTPPPSSQRSPDSPDSPRERALAIWGKIVHAVTWRFPVKFSALALALSLWVMVSAEEQTEAWVNVKVQIITDSSVSLVSDVPDVQALVGGRGRELLKLYTSGPAIRRVVGPDTPNQVTLDLRPGDVIIPANADVRVRDVTPRSIALDFEVTEQRYLPVRALVHLTTDSGMRITSGPRVLPGSVLVKGPRRAVRGLGSITTNRLNIFVHDTEIVRGVKLDTSGLGITDVTPSEVRVEVTAEQVAPPAPAPAPVSPSPLDTTPSAGVLQGETPDSVTPPGVIPESVISDSAAPRDTSAAPDTIGEAGSADSTETRP